MTCAEFTIYLFLTFHIFSTRTGVFTTSEEQQKVWNHQASTLGVVRHVCCWTDHVIMGNVKTNTTTSNAIALFHRSPENIVKIVSHCVACILSSSFYCSVTATRIFYKNKAYKNIMWLQEYFKNIILGLKLIKLRISKSFENFWHSYKIVYSV